MMMKRRTEALLGDTTIPALLRAAADERGSEPYLTFDGRAVTFDEMSDDVGLVVTFLRRHGIGPGARVAVMLPNNMEHVALILGILTMRAVWVPLNTKLRGEPLAHQLRLVEPELVIADEPSMERLEDTYEGEVVAWADTEAPWAHGVAVVGSTEQLDAQPDDVVSLMFTSGTTGPSKAVQVTDRMLRASAMGAVLTSGVGEGDVLMMWEPLCHIGGAQVLLVPLAERAQIALFERFSVAAFWDQAARSGATHIHHLGGILSMLLARPPSSDEHRHNVRVSWGGGMDPDTWQAVEQRFGIQVRECYGMTEASSVTTVNDRGPDHGAGMAVPYFQVEIHDETGEPLPVGERGEIVVRPLRAGLITPGYLNNPDATARAWRDGKWRTGDEGYMRDEAVHFTGRLGDSVRHRGENVSAWEVESVANSHPGIAESALIGVTARHGEQDLALFVSIGVGADVRPHSVIEWCKERLASFQVPRYIVTVDAFPKTPSQRIVKRDLHDRPEPWYDAENDAGLDVASVGQARSRQ